MGLFEDAFCVVWYSLNLCGYPDHISKMVREDKSTWKANYFERLKKYVSEYKAILIVSADNVGSLQMQQIRLTLREKNTVVLMGKNTMMRKALRGMIPDRSDLEKLLPVVAGNIGFVFTNEDLSEIRTILEQNKKEAPAKAGAISPVDVFIDKGNTGMGPEKTSFFQALAIATKITKGTIEILNDIHLIKKGEKVGASESALLGMLKIRPFHYGLVTTHVFEEGCVFDPAVLDMSQDDVIAKFQQGVANVTALSLGMGYPTVLSAPHSINAAFRKLAGVCLEADIDIPEVAEIKEFLADPSKFVVAAAEAAPAAAQEDAPAAQKEESEEDESDDDMGFGLFD